LSSVPSLSDLEKFIGVAEAGLGQQVEEPGSGGLVGVLGHLLAVKDRQNTTDAMFEPLQKSIALLKVYEQELPDRVYKQLEVKTDFQSLDSHQRERERERESLCTCLLICRSCPKSGPT